MADSVITAENLSKRYLLGHRTGEQGHIRHPTLRGAIAREAHNFARKAVDVFRGRQVVQGDEVEEFWALKNVSFEVKRGEIVGIIGRNGAGKSTLLKVLSRITEPTAGRVVMRGRVASLLEVGTGFHPELTGRENVFLNGAILGMTQSEIRKKFDEIVAFADVDRFLDTPVKRYSSGMYVRLAFAVAAHLEPEILIIDEVLSVGDHEFQKRCMGKIQDVSSQEGRTVLFVSHNLAAIGELATRAILMNSGTVELDGDVPQAILTYLSRRMKSAIYECTAAHKGPHLSKVEVITSNANGIHSFGEQLEIRFCLKHSELMSRGCFSFQIVNQFQHPVLHAWAFYPQVQIAAEGESVLVCRFPVLRLNVGQFYLKTYLAEPPGGDIYEELDGICQFEVVRTGETNLWGWHPETCSYYERWEWSINVEDAGRRVDRGSPETQ
jgi:lipopolysaccharide transport system ATP-binding protein